MRVFCFEYIQTREEYLLLGTTETYKVGISTQDKELLPGVFLGKPHGSEKVFPSTLACSTSITHRGSECEISTIAAAARTLPSHR